VEPHDKTDEELAREIKRGLNVEENFGQLYERHYAQIRRFFLRKRFSPEDSDELTQETFLSVYNGLKGFRQESSFDSWMFSIRDCRSVLGRIACAQREARASSLAWRLIDCSFDREKVVGKNSWNLPAVV
jgi:DNA-directed RNA polymerase specialized sigma24 family protein